MKIAFIGANARHPKAINHIVLGAVTKAGHEFLSYDSSSMDEKSAFEYFAKILREASLVIADVSDLAPPTALQIGAALQAGKPLISLAHVGTDAPSSILQGSAYLTYDWTERAAAIQERLIRRINEIEYADPIAQVGQDSNRKHNLFISYSHKDRAYLDRLLVHLRPLEREGRVDLWSDNHLRSGDRWRAEIGHALGRATMAVLLISADFMASDFITSNELPPLLKGAEEQGTKIIPVIIKPSRFAREPTLSQFQAANAPSKPFILLTEGEQEELLDRIAADVERIVGRGN